MKEVWKGGEAAAFPPSMADNATSYVICGWLWWRVWSKV